MLNVRRTKIKLMSPLWTRDMNRSISYNGGNYSQLTEGSQVQIQSGFAQKQG